MHLLIPGGPGLSVRTLERLSRNLKDCSFIPYSLPNSEASPAEVFENLVQTGVKWVAANSDKGTLKVVGHSFGGLVAKEISNRTDCRAFLISTPVCNQAYEIANRNYSAKASPETKEAEIEYSKESTDRNLTNWLGSYGSLYFSTQYLSEGRELLLATGAMSEVFQKLSDHGRQQCESISAFRTEFPPALITSEQDALIDIDVLESASNKFGWLFCRLQGGSHFSIFENAEEIATLVTNTNL
jgi:pimeloyl-ACP methyl ester carboxylesterase